MKKKTNKFTCNLGHNNINFYNMAFSPINYTINQKKNEKKFNCNGVERRSKKLGKAILLNSSFRETIKPTINR
jgi:hypothetical protein